MAALFLGLDPGIKCASLSKPLLAPQHIVGWVFRIRTELVTLNARPYPTGRSEECAKCNLKERYGWVPPGHCSGTMQWVPMQGGDIPPGAVQAGQDQDGGPLFVGRAFHHGDVLPCKICPTHGCAYVAFNGREEQASNYEVLVSDHVAWRSARDGDIPTEAIKIGQTSEGEPLYAGRAMHDGTLTPGKVHPSHRCLYIPYGGDELRFTDYEIMILM